MENHSLVSVGIPTYNRPQGLRLALECVTLQTYKNLEIIISDNFSTNPEVELVIKEYKDKDQRIRYFRNSENIGATKNFDLVLEKATGKYFMWAADDDEWDADYIQELVKLLENNNNKMAFSNYDYIFDVGGTSNVQNNWAQLLLTINAKSFEKILRLTLEYEVPADIIYSLFDREICIKSFSFMNKHNLWGYFASDKIFNLVVLSKTTLIVSDKILYRVYVRSDNPLSYHKGLKSNLSYYKGIFKAIRKCDMYLKEKIKLLIIIAQKISGLYFLMFRTKCVQLMVLFKIHGYYSKIKSSIKNKFNS